MTLQVKKKVLHIITGLDPGGAETMLYNLLSYTDQSVNEYEVISLKEVGIVGKRIQDLGVNVRSLGMKPGVPNPICLLKLVYMLRSNPPDVIQTWMYHADLIGGIAAKMAGNIPVVWGIHSNSPDVSAKIFTKWTINLCSILSKWVPTKIVCCSESAQCEHISLGYPQDKMIVIHNGFSTDKFRFNAEAKLSVRMELGIPPNTFLIGLIGNFTPPKDHQNFILAAKLISQKYSNVHFLLCGKGVTWDNLRLFNWIEEKTMRSKFHLLGRRDDIPRIMAALDILSLSSFSEAFPLVIGEAMASCIPCVVTDVGDSAIIVGSTGLVVPPRNPDALAKAWGDMINIGEGERARLGVMARQRIKEKFGLPDIVRQYEHLHMSLIKHDEAKV